MSPGAACDTTELSLWDTYLTGSYLRVDLGVAVMVVVVVVVLGFPLHFWYFVKD